MYMYKPHYITIHNQKLQILIFNNETFFKLLGLET
jgi:hypothetical protein